MVSAVCGQVYYGYYTNFSMRPSGRRVSPRLQASQAANTQSNSTHFHYQSVADTASILTTQNNTSRFSQVPRQANNRIQNTGPSREPSVFLPTRKNNLVSIHQSSLDEEKAMPSSSLVESYQSEASSPRFSYYKPVPVVTAQKSRLSRANHSSETSSEELDREQKNPLDETFSFDASKCLKDRQFQFCDTPKLPKETKSQKTSKPKQEDTGRPIEAKEGRMIFVKYDEGELTDQDRRYPYRASRAVPRLKFWEGERTDPKNHGYWKRAP